MKVLYIYDIKHLIIRFFRFFYKKLYTFIVFSYFLSCVMHVFLILLLYEFLYVKELIDVKEPEMVAFSIYQADQFLPEVLKKQKLLNITTVSPNSEEQKLKINSYLNKINTNMEVPINTSSYSDISIASKLQQQKKYQNNNATVVSTSTDFPYLLSNNKYTHNNEVHRNAPNVINRVYPEYPVYAKALGIEGKLTVVYNVNNLGRIENIRILSAVPVGVFEKNVLFAMRFWRYESNQSKKDLSIIFKFCLNNSNIEISDVQKN